MHRVLAPSSSNPKCRSVRVQVNARAPRNADNYCTKHRNNSPPPFYTPRYVQM